MSAAPRRRSLATAKEDKAPSADLVRMAAEFMATNAAANSAAAKAKKQRAALLAKMRDEGFRSFSGSTTMAGTPVAFDAVIAAARGTAIDVEKLRKVTTDDVFMACISATKGRVEEQAGSAVAAQCSVEVIGEENVSVKPHKG